MTKLELLLQYKEAIGKIWDIQYLLRTEKFIDGASRDEELANQIFRDVITLNNTFSVVQHRLGYKDGLYGESSLDLPKESLTNPDK